MSRQRAKWKSLALYEVRFLEMDVATGQQAMECSGRLRSQVHKRTPNDDNQSSENSLLEGARQVWVHTLDRPMEPIDLTNKWSSKVVEFQLAPSSLHNRPRHSFWKWEQVHNDHIQELDVGFSMAKQNTSAK